MPGLKWFEKLLKLGRTLRMTVRRLLSLLCCVATAFPISACGTTSRILSVSGPVLGYIGDSDEPYQGIATGYRDRTGTITMTNRSGVMCTGQFAYTGAKSGVGSLRCNDGQSAQVQFQSLSLRSGFGYGITALGKPIRFTYGLTAEESRPYVQLPSTSAPDASKTAGTITSGTGFFVSGLGHVLTNYHVVERCDKITVRLPSGLPVQALVVANDRSNDLTLLTTGEIPSAVATFRDGPSVRQGDAVVTYGFPLAGALSSQGNLTTGNVSALTGLRDDSRYLQITAPIQVGNSGGPLLDSSGAVVGVVQSKLNALRVVGITGDVPQNVNFAMKGTVARTFLESQGVRYATESATKSTLVAELAEQAKTYTVAIECRR